MTSGYGSNGLSSIGSQLGQTMGVTTVPSWCKGDERGTKLLGRVPASAVQGQESLTVVINLKGSLAEIHH
jgi:hypothetical protein